MKSRTRRRTLATAALAATTLVMISSKTALAAGADAYPNKPIRLIVGYAPGGMTDSVSRALAMGLAKVLGQSVVVENHAGAGGTIGATAAAKASPDGYTLVVTGPPQVAIAPLMLAHRPYDALKDFTPIASFVNVPDILVVNPSVPVKNLAELIAYAKGPGQGKVRYASGGPGSSGQLHGESLNKAAGMDMIEVPYGNSSSTAFPDVIAGRVEANYAQVPGTIGFVRSGQVRPIVVLSEKRSELLPDVPTVSEAGYPSATMDLWQGVEGPAGIPPAIVAKLNAAIRTAMASPETAKAMNELGAQSFVTTPDEFRALRKRDIARYAEMVKQLNLAPN
jgi:tripartite-type tricarboxylate transporter receptor subunit TctC